ncbi:HCP-like protein, partial [Saitoella complicata NRRL Y-17804]
EPRLQLTLAKRLIEAATVLADEGGKADPKTTRANKEKYITEAYQIIKKLAVSSRPYPPAMFFLANAFGNGALGLAIDHERAFNLYHSASKLQHPESCYRTAVCCEVGAGTKKDAAKAMQFYKKAALLSDTAAMYKLGMIMLKGLLGQTRSPREAIGWLKRAADQADVENPHALHELGLLYESTDPDPTGAIIRDEAYARDLFTKAAQLGYPPSQFRLGCAYEYGSLKCPVDPRRSIAWYARAAEKAEPESELALSGWYLTGAEGILGQSDTEAYLWARKAAEKGSAKAEFAVGYYTETGIGVPQDIEEAKKWYRRAA